MLACNLIVVPLEAAQLPRSLGDIDFAFINGNFAIASGLELEEALERVETPPQYMNNVVYWKEDLEKPLTQLSKIISFGKFLHTNEHKLFGKTRLPKGSGGRKVIESICSTKKYINLIAVDNVWCPSIR